MSYDMIDRFLRNNLGDDDYAEYSAALDSLCTQPRKPLTHEQRVDLLAKFEAHNHEWHAPAILIDMVEAAHGIKENT